MRPKVCFILNSLSEFVFAEMLELYLPAAQVEVTVAQAFPEDPNDFQLIVPWNYRRVIAQASAAGNVLVFHASDLPVGRGWSPIYHTFREERPEYVLCGILATNAVDQGDIVIRARFDIVPGYTAPFLRQLDLELGLLLVAKTLWKWPDQRPEGKPQQGDGNYEARRRPGDSEIDPRKTISELLPHLRGVEDGYPAFFTYCGGSYSIQVKPVDPPKRPRHVLIDYPALGQTETWDGWS